MSGPVTTGKYGGIQNNFQQPLIAHAHLIDGGSNFRSIPSSPGRRVDFRANYAPIRDERDLISCLRYAGCQVEVDRDYVDWIAQRMNDCGVGEGKEPRAKVVLPQGYLLLHFPPTAPGGDHWELATPEENAQLDGPNQMTNGAAAASLAWIPPAEKRGPGRPPKVSK